MMRKIIYLLMAITCVSCVTIGTKFDLSDVDQLIPGKSTLQDASDLLGPPMAASAMDNGATLYQWQYVRAGIGRGSTAFTSISFDAQKVMIRMEQQAGRNMSMH